MLQVGNQAILWNSLGQLVKISIYNQVTYRQPQQEYSPNLGINNIICKAQEYKIVSAYNRDFNLKDNCCLVYNYSSVIIHFPWITVPLLHSGTDQGTRQARSFEFEALPRTLLSRTSSQTVLRPSPSRQQTILRVRGGGMKLQNRARNPAWQSSIMYWFRDQGLVAYDGMIIC